MVRRDINEKTGDIQARSFMARNQARSFMARNLENNGKECRAAGEAKVVT